MKADYSRLDTASPKDCWVILGPGGGGCVHTLAVSPHHPRTLLVSCDMTAGYITHDGGQSWREFNLKSRQYAYAFDPVDADVIYAGSSGLFRSEDGGSSWHLLFPNPAAVIGETRLGDEATHSFLSSDNWPGGTIHAILVDPLWPEHLFVAVKKDGGMRSADIHCRSEGKGLAIFASTDRGLTWESHAELDAADIHLLAFDPGSAAGARALYAFTEGAIVRVLPDGKMQRLALPESVLALRHAGYGVNPETGRTVYFLSAVVASSDCSPESSVWKSTDLGATWQRSTAGLEADGPPAFSQVSACAHDARRVWLIAERFPERDESGRHVASYGILRSDDEGTTWQWAVKLDDDHDPPNRVGGWAERDYGAYWGDIKGDDQISPKGRFAWDVVASPVDQDVCYTMDFSTIFETRDGGKTWEQLVTHLHADGSVSSRGVDVLSAYDVSFDPFDPDHTALAMTDVGVFHSLDGGRTWHHALAGVPRSWTNTCYCMVFDPEVRGHAWSAWSAMHDIPRGKMFVDELFQKHEGGICVTVDGLQSWQPSAQGMPRHALCTHLVLDPASPARRRILYAAVFGSGVYKSTDDGYSWHQKSRGLDPRNPFAWRLALLPTLGQDRGHGMLYLVVVKNRLEGRELPGAVFRSVDGAETWEPLPLPEGVDFPNDLAFDLSGRLYLACWPRLSDGKSRGGGAYASDDGGQTWNPIFDPEAHVYTITVDPRDEATLYLSTFHAAIYRSNDRGNTWMRLKGFNFPWAHRPIPDPHHPGMLYVTTFGSSIWYGPEQGVEHALEDIC